MSISTQIVLHYTTIDPWLSRPLRHIMNVLIAAKWLLLLAFLILLCWGVKIFGSWQLLDTLYLGGDVYKVSIIGKIMIVLA